MLKLRSCQRLKAAYARFMSQPATVTALTEAEYTETPEYPPIRDLSFKAKKEQTAAEWHEELRQVPTVEEKLIKINMPRYYGFKVVHLDDQRMPYNVLEMTQHYTRTHIEKWPEKTQTKEQGEDKIQALVKATRGEVIEALEFAHECFKAQTPEADPVLREQQLTQIIVEQVNRALLQLLQADYNYLQELEVDYNPRHEAFWAVGGVRPPKNVVRSKEGRKWQKSQAQDPVDRLVQYTGSPYLALRHRLQLTNWKTMEESVNLAEAQKLPRFEHDARTLGYSTNHQHAVNVPGYWPSSAGANFGFLSFQSRTHLEPDQLLTRAIQSSYAWLLAQAHYNGFNTYNDLTYPLNTQTIVTNGREWSFFEYQLNTLLKHGRHVDENPRLNFCRGSEPLSLYGHISEQGKLLDFNDDTLRELLAFYVNPPTIQRSSEELQPYVHSRLADYDNPEQRDFIDKTFKHLASKRPRHLELPEIYMWEKLYKIDYKTRPMEAKRRFFELDINPWRRTLDQHDKVYVSRSERPGGRNNREGRFKKTYYP